MKTYTLILIAGLWDMVAGGQTWTNRVIVRSGFGPEIAISTNPIPDDPIIHGSNFFSVFTPHGDLTVKIEPNLDNPTNIVIGADYKGTVQVGTNVFPLQNFKLLASLDISTNASDIESMPINPMSQELTTNWIDGEPMRYNENEFESVEHKQFGLRSDGVVVWRKSR